jgi:hypothetical protein
VFASFNRPDWRGGAANMGNAMRWLCALSLLALCACESRIEKAEREYEMAKRAGADAAEICARGRAVTEAYLQQGDEMAYQQQKVRADIACQGAEMDQRDGIVRGPDGNVIRAEAIDDTNNAADAAFAAGAHALDNHAN